MGAFLCIVPLGILKFHPRTVQHLPIFALEFNMVTLIKNNYIYLPAHVLSKAWISQFYISEVYYID